MRLISNNELSMVSGGEYGDLDASGQPWGSSGGPVCLPSDWCSNVPDSPFGYEFGGNCRTHDINYGPDTPYTRSEADSIFLSDMIATCNNQYDGSLLCKATAVVYYVGVRVFGGSHYEGNK